MAPRFPFPHPNGWFRVAFESELEAGLVRPLRYFGRELVLVVFEDGTPRVFDAFCPHLGAHLGHGGHVAEGTLRCPFHGWRFAADGACVGVDYAKRVPAGAALRAWPSVLRSGIVWVWHHAGGASPEWDVPEVEVVGHPDWTPLHHEPFRVRTCNQEIAENTSDPAHFGVVHGFTNQAPPEIAFEAHRCRSVTRYDAPNARGDLVASSVEVEWHGLGIGVTRSRGSLELAFIGTGTPVDAESVDYCFSFTVCGAEGFSLESGAGRAAVAEAMRQVRQDIPIWENKRYLPTPKLCDGDGPIARFREWAGQFYLEVPA